MPPIGPITDPAELAAFAYVPRLLGDGVVAEPFDHSGRQGAVDFVLHYPDGHDAALEVTSAAESGFRQLASLLNDKYETLPNPGEWTWSAEVGHPRDLPELAARAGAIILWAENNGVRDPKRAWSMRFNPDIAWLMGSTCELHGTPTLPKWDAENGRERPLFVTPSGRGGGVNESLCMFADAIDKVVAETHVKKRVAKLGKSGLEEQHLFVLLDESALDFEVAYALATRDVMPPTPPRLPGTLTHLWLLVTFSPWVFLVTSGGLQRFPRSE